MRGLGQPPPFRNTCETFISLFSCEWQASNAAIIGQWLSMCKRLRLRGISRRDHWLGMMVSRSSFTRHILNH